MIAKSSAKTIYLQTKEKKENILNQQFNPKSPNEEWVSDVTYFKLKGKLFYICVILDLYSRKIISLTVSKRNSTWLTKSTLATAYKTRTPDVSKLIFHSDQGSNYTANAFIEYAHSLGIKQSFSRKAMPYDNSVCESFFNILKREELYRTNYRSEKNFKNSLTKYVDFYNQKRPHSFLNYRTPNKAEDEFYCCLRRKEVYLIEHK